MGTSMNIHMGICVANSTSIVVRRRHRHALHQHQHQHGRQQHAATPMVSSLTPAVAALPLPM
eukprot:2451597-Alexandrium_andersonii.AAC.1